MPLSIGQSQIIPGTCKYYTATGTMYYQTRLIVLLNSQSSETNLSNVTETLQIQCVDEAYRTYGVTATPTLQGVGGAGVTIDTDPINTWDTIGVRTFGVAHNDNGDLTFNANASFVTSTTSAWGLKSGICSDNVTLTTIPRASPISSFNDFQIETTAGAISGNANIYSASFYHRFKLFQGSTEVASWDIGQLPVGAYAYALSLTATQRNAIFAAMPTIDNQLFTLQLITYNDAARTVQIGSTQTKTATGTIPLSYKPVITTSNTNFTWTNKNSKLTSYLIQNISTLTLLLSGGVAPTGASLANYQVRYGSILRSGAYTGSAISENVGLIADSGTLYAYYSVQDSRGRWSAEISEQLLGNALGVQAYNPPLNNGFDIRRNTSIPTSADYILKFANSLYSLGNTWTYTLYYWNVSTWTVAKAATAIASASIDTIYTHALPYSESSVYDVKVVLTDQFNSPEYTDTMPTSEFPASFGKKGMGIGKDTSDTYNLEVGLLGLSSDGPILMKNTSGVLTSIINLFYPVGQVIFSINPANPGTYIPGTTWVAFGAGRTPFGVDTAQTEFNTVQKTGGEKAHILTNSELPTGQFAGAGTAIHGTSGTTPTYWMFNENSIISGGGVAHNTLPPYITLYMWKRTA